jgi:hypothetical protein
MARAGLAALFVVLWASPASAADGNLPAGTSISVTIDDPVTSTEFLIPTDSATRDIDVSGTASIAEGVPVKDTTLVFVADRSGSMNENAGVDCDGSPGSDSRLVCEKNAIVEANAAAAAPNSVVGLAGLASFASAGTAHDVDLGAGGTQTLVAPGHDGNGNAVPDLSDVVLGLSASGQTNYAAGLADALAILNDPANTSAFNLVLFLSDADATSLFVGSNVSTLAGSVPANTTIRTFGIGSGPSCSFDGGTGSLNDIAALSTTGDGTCRVIDQIGQLADEIVESLGSTLDTLTIDVDGAGPVPITNADITPDLPVPGPGSVGYATTVPGLGPGDHEICVTAHGTDAGGTGSVTECVTIHLLKITVAPEHAVNELGTPGQTHTVTATILGPASGSAAVGGRLVSFDVISGPNAGAAGTATTDAAGQASFTYTAQQGLAGLGTDVIRACFTLTDPTGETGCDDATKTWQDTTPPSVHCVETTNPHGHNVPPAGSTTPPGSKGGQNEDGFYELTASDAVDPDPDVFLVDTGSGTVFGPFDDGTRIKYTEAPGASPKIKKIGSATGQAGAVDWHVIGSGDAAMFAVDFSGNVSDRVACLVPPPPK